MAAYLLGERGSFAHAALIALTVTVTHTAGVLVLGLVLSLSTTLAPEAVYPWLGLVSGATLAAVGLGLLRRAVGARRGLPTQVDDRGHVHGDHHHAPLTDRAPVSLRSLVAVGVAGGMVPSPSALVVLLGALALGRAWFGVVLVVAYGAGMALTLVAAGLVLVRARGVLDRRASSSKPRSQTVAWVSRALPAATAMVIVVVGLFLAARGVSQI
jgi:ABC-type nickel/cobalt efflux system permease component RcnA